MKVLKKIKDIFFKIFGKAWWFVVALSVICIYYLIIFGFTGFATYVNGIIDDSGNFIREIETYDNDCFSVNSNGTMVLTGYEVTNGVAAIMDFESGETLYSNINQITIDVWDDYFEPYNFVITDDNVIYAVRCNYFDGDDSAILASEAIVRIDENYEYMGTVSEILYDTSSRQRYSKISRLNYFDGKVTYATVDDMGVYLYTIDAKTQVLSQSGFYPTEENGTFTTRVIPVDGSFIFIRSDGNVYRTGFDEPLGDPIYHFDIDVDGNCVNPPFDTAAVVNGKLYVSDSYYMSAVYELVDGELVKVFDIDEEYSYIVAMDSYRYSGDSADTLILCLDSCILTYYDGKLNDVSPVVTFNPTFLMVMNYVIGVLFILVIIAIFINLIIRKKSLMYKQLIIIIPVISVLSIIIAAKVFEFSDNSMISRINKDLTIICDLGKSEFEGFDFTDVMSVNDNTGITCMELNEKFEKLASSHGHDWGHSYVFSVVYINDYGDLVTLAGDDYVYLPMYYRDYERFSGSEEVNAEAFIDNSLMSFLDDNGAKSNISAFGKIADKNNTGKYYFMVSTDNSSLYQQRILILAEVIVYCILVIFVLALIIVLTCLNTMRVIKKATKAVKEISNGNLSARINYKSKDELGQICSEVNAMGKSLETLFEEKDKTEQFYYKFVPEKFRELLGKENFTDLALGDAKSCELTVLFTDIRGFSINSEMMTAKENFAFANIIYGKMGPIVRKNNGFVDKYIGDAVMGLFENADDAVRCGIEMYKSIVLDPKTAEELNVSDINIGIGIHTGMAMVGIVGESERLSGTGISETVNMSSRLESLTKQYKTAMLISKSTVDRMKDPDSLNLRYLGIVQVAGVNEVEALYEVLDCLDENNKAKRSANNIELREAIRLFSLGRRKEAENSLQLLADSGKSDYVTDLYLNYIKGMSEDDKGNVFRFSKK